MLQQARRSREGDEVSVACEFVVWFSYTKDYLVEKGQEMIQAGQKFHREDVELHVGCPHRHPEECFWAPKVPKSRRFYSEPEDSGKMAGMARDFFKEIEDDARDTRIRLRNLVLGQEFPDGLAYVPGSASEDPSDEEEGGAGTRLEWTWRNIRSLEPFTVTYQLTPTLSGAWPVTGDLKLTDMQGKINEDMADAGSVEVLDEICYPTPTPSSTPMPTPTDTAEPPPTVTPTPTITLTPTPSVRIIYLPIARRDPEICVPESIYTDAVLVLDMSTSMYRETRSGRSKHQAALAAARAFVEQLELEEDPLGRRDRVGIAGFNDAAWTAIGLSSEGDGIDAAISALLERIAQGTRLDLALLEGQAVLDGSERVDGNRPVLILLTDGLPNRVPLHPVSGRQEETVLEAAEAAKSKGTRVFTIGLGNPEDVAHELLEAAASDPDDFYYAPDGDDLESIYRQIAGRITECPEP